MHNPLLIKQETEQTWLILIICLILSAPVVGVSMRQGTFIREGRLIQT